MSEEQAIRVQYEAIRKFSAGDKALAYKIIHEHAPTLRQFIDSRAPLTVTADDLCAFIGYITRCEETNNQKLAQAK